MKRDIKRSVFIGIRVGACVLFGTFWLSGCDNKAAKVQKPVVVTQKIAPPKTATAEKQTPPPPAKQTDAGQEKKTDPTPGAVAEKSKSGSLVSLINLFNQGKSPSYDSYKALYDPEGKIDPFKPLFGEAVEPKKKPKPKPKRPLTPLERVDLSQLKLVAVILAPSGNRALVKEASGKGYIIKKDTPIGIHSGRVIQILKSSLLVKEEVEDTRGKISIRQREMKLQKPPGE